MALYSTFTDAIDSYLGLSPTAFFTILALMVGAYLLVSSCFVSPEAAASEAKNRSAPPPEPVIVPAEPVQLGDVTLEALKAYDGSDPKKPLLMAIKGSIYDVSRSRMFYGPGGPYALFAGRDASRALALMSFDSNDLTGNLEGLSSSELERNYNRFGGWLGKNSTMGKNLRLLEDAHLHILASQGSNLDRSTLRTDYFSLLLKQLIEPLRVMPKDAAVQKVVDFMNAYSLTQDDFDTIVELSKFQTHPNPLEGIQPAVKAALTKAYKEASKSRVVRTADLINLPGLKKAPKKRIAAILEPVDPVDSALPEENGDSLVESEEENSDDAEDTDGIKINREAKPKLDIQSDKSKGIQVQLDLKSDVKSNAKKTPASKSRASASAERGQGSGRGGKRKR